MRKLVSFLTALFVCVSLAGAGADIAYFRNGEGGFFRVTLSAGDIVPGMESGFHAVPDSENVFGIHVSSSREGYDSFSGRRIQTETSQEERDLDEKRNKIQSERSKLWQDQQFNKSLLEHVEKGEVKISPEERRSVESRQKELEERGKLLDDQESEIYNRLQSAQHERYQNPKPGVSGRDKPIFKIEGRFRNGGAARLKLAHPADGRVLKEIPLLLPDDKTGDQEVMTGWLDRAEDEFGRLGVKTPGDSVFTYIKAQLRRMFLKGNSSRDSGNSGRQWGRGAGGRPDLFSLTTGALAIQESLQLDRMIGSDKIPGKASIPIGKLAGPQVKSHPFVEMIGTGTPELFPMDSLVPEEFYACHFTDINRQIALSDLMDLWGTSLLQSMQVSSHDARVKEKYLDQLCLQLSELTRLFGDQVIGDLMLCGSDPFLHEGTDVSVILAIKNRTLFDLQFRKNIELARLANPGVKEETLRYQDVPILAVTNKDRRVYSFSCALGDFAVISNCPKSLEMMIEAWKGMRKSLAKADDFRYMRTIFRTGSSEEDFFLYFSDRHIRNLVGPVWKIARQRRMQCISSLRIIQNSLALWGSEGASGTPTIERLKAGWFIEEAYMNCPEGGDYSIDPDSGEPVCSKHGRLRYIVPIVEMQPELVSEPEKAQYGQFVKEYNSYWSKFFDPIGIRGKVGTEVVQLETCILPLIENTVYDLFRGFAGGTPAKLAFPEHPRTIGQFICKLNLPYMRVAVPESRGSLEPVVRRTTLTVDELIDSLGDGVEIGLVDSAPTFNLVVPEGAPMLPGLLGNPVGLLAGSFVLAGLNFPTYAAVAVKKPAAMERFIWEWLRSNQAENELDRAGRRSFLEIELNAYKAKQEGKEIPIFTLDLLLVLVRFHFFFAIHDGFLLASNRRDILLDLLGSGVGKFEAEANLLLRVVPERFKEVADTSRLLWQERIRKACLNNLGSLSALYHYRGILPADWAEKALPIIGYAPFCPLNGFYEIDPVFGEVRCSLHGSLDEPRQPLEYDSKQPLQAFFSSLKEVESSLQFTPEGVMTRVILRR